MVGTKPLGRHPDKRLSAAFVRSATRPGLHGDGNGLYLKVDPSGARRWIQRLVVNGKRCDIGLGSAALVSLADARDAALENRKRARSGGDPIAERKLAAGSLSFRAAAEKVHALNEPTWRNDKHGKQWLSTLETYAYPHFGSKRINAVTGADVLTALTEIWNVRPETARRVKQRIGMVFKWAMAQGLRSDNPADVISQALPKHDRSKVQHRKALPYGEVSAAIAKVRASGAGQSTKLAFELLVLTASRSGEMLKAVWSEFDIEKQVWTIPASRMKAKKVHRVPLAPRCLEVLEQAQALKSPDSELVFPGSVKSKPLSDMTLSKLMKELQIPAVPHGFRSSFRDWAGEQTSHPHQVCEFALAHVIRDKAEAAYARSDLFDKRRALMDDWCSYLDTVVK